MHACTSVAACAGLECACTCVGTPAQSPTRLSIKLPNKPVGAVPRLAHVLVVPRLALAQLHLADGHVATSEWIAQSVINQ